MSAALAMPLDEVATVALREFFKAQHGRHKLPVNVQASLTRYFARRVLGGLDGPAALCEPPVGAAAGRRGGDGFSYDI